jgi:hypothetical protein
MTAQTELLYSQAQQSGQKEPKASDQMLTTSSVLDDYNNNVFPDSALQLLPPAQTKRQRTPLTNRALEACPQKRVEIHDRTRVRDQLK